jgi:AmpE protein
MTFIIILISLVIERFFDWSHLRKWRWFSHYQQWVSNRFARWSPEVILGICLLLPLLGVGFVNFLLSGWLYVFFKILFGIVVLVYCLGPVNFWAQSYACLKIIQGEDAERVNEEMYALLGIKFPANLQAFHQMLTRTLFVQCNREVFAVFFWFMILGPVGAVLYRLVDLSKTNDTLAVVASKSQQLLNWLPVRVFTLIFALVGHFTEVIKYWQKYAKSGLAENDSILTGCGMAALDLQADNFIAEDGAAEKDCLALLDRVFIVGLVLLAIVVLVL